MEEFLKIKKVCNGMLHTDVYNRLSEVAKDSNSTTLVEVGTAHAAGTVSIALGAHDSGKSIRVYSFDKIVGGSRDAYGGLEENLEIIKRNLSHFGVSDIVELVIGDVRETHTALPEGEQIGFLMLDADGRIDRDFDLFFNRVAPGAPIVIDDYEDRVRVKPEQTPGQCSLDLKKKLSWMLADYFKAQGWIRTREVIRGTLFAEKAIDGPVEMNWEEITEIYRNLVFVEGDVVLPSGTRGPSWLRLPSKKPHKKRLLKKIKRALR